MRRWLPLVAVCLGSFVFLLDTTVVTVALPDIGRDLHGSLAGLQWVLNIYTLVLAVLMLTAGGAADRYGHRRVFLAGLAAFAATSLACSLAPSVGLLIAFRGIQGAGGAALAVTGFTLIGANYAGPALGTAFGIYFGVNGLGAAVGPLVGGVLTQYVSWRAVFLLNLPLAAATALLARRTLTAPPPSGTQLDLPGTALFGVFASCLTIGLTRGSEGSWASPATASVLLGAALALAVFTATALRRSHPLVDVRLFAATAFSTAMFSAAASSIAFAGLIYTSVWLQSGLRLDPVRAGEALIPLAGAAFAVSALTGRRLHRIPGRYPVGAGLLLVAAGCALQARVGPLTNAAGIIPGLLVTGIGVGLIGPALGAAVTAAAPPQRAGMAGGAMTTFRQLGQTLGVAVLGIFFGNSTSFFGNSTSGPAIQHATRAAMAHGLRRADIAAAAAALTAGVLTLIFVRPARADEILAQARAQQRSH